MSALTAFEVQSFRNGAWKIEAITDSKDIAVHQAEHIMKNAAIKKVRVVQETIDPESAEQKIRVVFVRDKQASKPAEAAPPAQPPAPGQPPDPTPRGVSAPVAAAAAATHKHWSRSAVGMILNFGAIIVAGIAAILAIRYLGASP